MSTSTDGDTGDAEVNTKFAQLKVPVPRDPAAYSRTDHFRQRQKYRRNPEIEISIVEECIRTGYLKCVDQLDCPGPTDDARIGTFAFEKTIGEDEQHDWRVIVGLHRDAFFKDAETHAVVTAYCNCHGDDPEEVCQGVE